MKSTLIPALLAVTLTLSFSKGAEAACPRLTGNYARCTTTYEGQPSASGSVVITSHVDARGETVYDFDITGGDGTRGPRTYTADGAPYSVSWPDPNGFQFTTELVTVSSCSTDGKTLTVKDEYQLIKNSDPTDIVRYSTTITHTRDRRGALMVVTDWQFENGPLHLTTTCE